MKLENGNVLWKRRINYRDLNRSERKKTRITPVIMFPQNQDIMIYVYIYIYIRMYDICIP